MNIRISSYAVIPLFMSLLFSVVSEARSEGHDSIPPEELTSFSDTLFQTKLGVVSTDRDFLTFTALVFKLIEVIGAEEGWNPKRQYDFLIISSTPNIRPDLPMPNFLTDFDTEPVQEVMTNITDIVSNCHISSSMATTGESVLIILSTFDVENPNLSMLCVLEGLTLWAGWDPAHDGGATVRSSLIDLLKL